MQACSAAGVGYNRRPMLNRYVVHYSEIGLKGRNRPEFEKRLILNIERQLGSVRCRRVQGRILIEADRQLDLSRIFGIAWWAPVVSCGPGLDQIAETAIELARDGLAEGERYAVRAKLGFKPYVLNSHELEIEIGGRIQQALGFGVNLTEPDLTVNIEVLQDFALLFGKRFPGPGGLPVGSTGKLMGLFSGGIDSAVAAYLLAKRGVRVELVHFYALPSAAEVDASKIGALARHLSTYLPTLRIHFLPYHDFQLATADLPGRLRKYELVTFRRFMVRVAERLARRKRCGALFTGDSLAQVASQTLENLSSVHDVHFLPLFRPLIGFDKIETIRLAQSMGAYDLAVQDYKDCCSIISRHPATRANRMLVEEVEELINVPQLVERALRQVENYEYRQGQVVEAVPVPGSA